MSLNPVINIRVLLRRSPARATLNTGALKKVATAGMPLSGPEKSKDFRRCTDSMETAGSLLTEPLALGMSGPRVCCGIARPATASAYASPPVAGAGPLGRTVRTLDG